MRSLTLSRHQKKVCQLLLVAFWFCLTTSVRPPDIHAQQTAQQANALLDLSKVQNKTDNQQALQTAQQALEIFTGLGDQAGIAEAKMWLAKYHTALGNLNDATGLYEQIRPYWQAQQNKKRETETLLSLSIIEQRKGDWLNAIQYLAQAEPLVATLDDPEYPAIVSSLTANIYNQHGLHQIARTEYQNAQDHFAKIPDNTRNVNRMKMLIGYTYLLEENYAAAATHLNEALATFTIDLDKANCYEYLGRVHMGLQEYDVALQHLQTALESYEAAHNPIEAARVLALIAQINEQQGALAQARTRYRNALLTFQKVEDRVNEAAVNFSLGKLELKARYYDQAETYLKHSLETTEILRRASIAHDLTSAYSATVHERYQTYIECLIRKQKLRPSQRLHIEAFQTSELARARSLAELLRYNPPAAGPHQALAKQERALRLAMSERTSERIKLLANVNTAEPKERANINASLIKVEAKLNEVRREHAQIAEKLRSEDPLFAQIQQPTAYSLEQIQREVIDDDQTVLLEFMLGDEASYAWAVRKNDFKFYELQNRTTINTAADALYKLLSNRPNDDTEQQVKQASAQLTKLVLEPLKEQLNARRLIIVADGALHYVPFQLLPVPGNENELLVANYEIVNAPSGSILGQLRKQTQQRQPTKRLLAAFGDPVFPANYAEFKGSGGGELLASAKPNPLEPWRRAARDIEIDADNIDASMLQPLTFSKFELQKLSELGGSTAMIARGFEASRENLTRINLSDFSVLHFATHGVLDPKDPEVTGFFLSMLDDSGRPQNGFITTPDIYALHAPVDLVVLSACRTGLGKGVRGEGLIGLTSGFMHAGASSVAASLWKVDDNATSHLMDHFYTNMLQKNMRPAEALRAAQNVLRQDPRWQSPHYWAGFTLQGEYQNTIRIPPPTGASQTSASHTVKYVVGAVILVLLLLGIGWGFWRRRGRRTAL